MLIEVNSRVSQFSVPGIGQLRTCAAPAYIPCLEGKGFTALFDKKQMIELVR